MSKQLRIGVFVSDKGQMLDVATVDVLGSMSKEYLCMIPFASKSLVDSAPSVSIFYIATPSLRAGVPLTSGMTIKPTHVYSDPEVAPGKLDIIVVPGTDPVVTHEEGGLRWLREHFETPGVDVLSVCTGLFICAQAGIADGRRASGPREMQDWLRQAHPKIKLAGEELRWVQDGNLWSSGSVTNGNDLMGAYARSGKHWTKEVAEFGMMMTSTGDRPQAYVKTPAEHMEAYNKLTSPVQ